MAHHVHFRFDLICGLCLGFSWLRLVSTCGSMREALRLRNRKLHTRGRDGGDLLDTGDGHSYGTRSWSPDACHL